jgi:hypothetical protein
VLIFIRYKINCIRCILLLCLFFFSAFNYAQQAIVKGKITSGELNLPVEDVQISIEGSSQLPVFSDNTGYYQISVPANKEIILVFSNLSYQTLKKKFQLLDSEIKLLNPVLIFRNDLTGIDVVDEQRETETIKLNPTQITQLPGASMDIMRLLPSMGIGVAMTNELSSGYSVRGGNFDENLVYVNDIEVYRPFLVRSGQQEGLSFPNPDMVANMSFSAGGFEAKYGDKLSSVLDITYRKPRKFSSTATMSLLGAGLHVENITDNKLLSWQIGARYKTNQYLLRSIDTKGDYFPRFYDVQSLLNFNVSPKFNVDVLGVISGNKYQVIPQTRETTFGTFNQALQFKVYFDGQEVSKFNTLFGAVSVNFLPSEKLRLKWISSYFNTQESETFTIQGQYYINELETDLGDPNFGNVAFNRGIGTFINNGRNYLNASVFATEHKGFYTHKNGELLWGLKLQHEIINDKLGEWNFIDSAGYSIPQGDPLLVELRDVIKTKIQLQSNRIMAYTQYVFKKQLKDSAVFSFTGGIRSNYWSLNNDNVISPRLTFSYEPNWKADWLFKASWGYYYQPPFYREMRDFIGNVNKDLKAQQSIHYVLSGDLNFKMWNRPFKFITAAYFKQFDNLVPYEIDNVRIRYYGTNSSKGFATGMDFRLNGEFVKGIESWVNMSVMTIQEDLKNDFYYTYRDSLGNPWYKGYSNLPVNDSTLINPGYIPRPTDQRVTFNLFFQDYLPKIPSCKMHLNLIYGTGLPFGPPSRERYKDTLRMPAYRRVDIGFSYQLIKEERTKKDKGFFRYVKTGWLSLEILNLLAVNNTVSFTWIKDVTNRQYAIPNYLTNRQLNLKIQFRF